MKKKHKWALVGILLGIIIGMWYFGFLSRVYAWIVGVQANTIIAIFTIVLAFTTIAYAIMTSRLLQLNYKSLLIDLIVRISQHTETREQRYLNQLTDKIQSLVERKYSTSDRIERNFIEDWIILRTSAETEPYYESLIKTIQSISKKLGKGLDKSIEDYIAQSAKTGKKIRKDLYDFESKLLEDEKILMEVIASAIQKGKANDKIKRQKD
ncbi:hypothetical protein ES702_05574 [subsurface metagenome]